MPLLPSRSRWLTIAQWVLTLAVVAAMGVLLQRNGDELRGLLTVDIGTLAAMSLGAVIVYIASGMVIQALVSHFGCRMPLWETVLIGLMDNTLNYLPMKAGTVATGVYLCSRLPVAPSEYAALVVGSSVLNLWTTTTLGGALLLTTGNHLWGSLALTGLPTLAVGGLMLWSRGRTLSVSDEKHRFVRAAWRSAEGVRSMMADVGLVARLIGINLLRVGGAGFQLYWAFRALSHPISPGGAVALSAIAVVLQRATVLPGGLGFREGGIAGAAPLFGVAVPVGLAAAVIDRAVQMATVVVFGLPATLFLTRVMKRASVASSAAGVAEEVPDA